MSLILPQRPPVIDLEAHWFDLYNHTPKDGVIPSSVGDTSRLPQPGRAYNFDGVDDHTDHGIISGIPDGSNQPFTFSIVYNVTSNQGTVFGLSESNAIGYLYNHNSDGKLTFQIPTGSGNRIFARTVNSVPFNTDLKVTISYDGGLTINSISFTAINLESGELIDVTQITDNGSVGTFTTIKTDLPFKIGKTLGNLFFQGKIYELKGWLDNDEENPFILINCEDTGLIAFDSSGNGNHGTKVNTDVLGANTFSYEGDDVPTSYQNEIGYSDGDGSDNNGLYIPRDESNPTLDVLGNPLQYKGKVSYPAKLVESNCLSFDGVDDQADFPISFGGFNDGTTNNPFAIGIAFNLEDNGLNQMFFGKSIRSLGNNFKYSCIILSDGSIFWRVPSVDGSAGTNNIRLQTQAGVIDFQSNYYLIVGYDGTLNSSGLYMYLHNIDTKKNIELTFTRTDVGTFNTGPRNDSTSEFELAGRNGSEVQGKVYQIKTYQEIINEAQANTIFQFKDLGTEQDKVNFSEGNGTTAFEEIRNNHGTLVNGVSWAKQDVYHYNYENGYSLYQHNTDIVANPDIRVPLGIDPVITDYTKIKDVQPSLRNHNGAETKVDFNPYNAPALSELGVQEIKNNFTNNLFISKKGKDGESLFYKSLIQQNRITNYLKYLLEPETIAYVNRVEADGGEILNINWVDSAYKKLKKINALSNLRHLVKLDGGIKKDVNNFISNIYSLYQTTDFKQLTGSNQPVSQSSEAIYDGVNDFMNVAGNYDFFHVLGVFSIGVTFKLQDFSENRLNVFYVNNSGIGLNTGIFLAYDNRQLASPNDLITKNALRLSITNGQSGGNPPIQAFVPDSINDNLEHTFYCTGNGSRVKMYLDGELILEQNFQGPFTNNTSSFNMIFGRNNNDSFPFKGNHQLGIMLSKELTQQEIQELNTL